MHGINWSSDTQIEQEEVHASLDQAEGMVSFSESPEGYDSLPMATYLHTQVSYIDKLPSTYIYGCGTSSYNAAWH